MTRPHPGLGRLLLATMLVATIAAEITFTWLGATGEHVFNPDWHPHARYHAAWVVAFVIAMALVGLGVLWRRPHTPRAARIVAVPAVLYWASEFFAFAVVPGTDPSPDLAAPNTFPLLGADVHGNLVFAGAMILLSVLGALLAGALSASSSAAPEPAAR